MGNPLLRLQYFRVAIGAFYSVLAELVCSRVHWREVSEHRRDDAIGLRISWV